MVTAGIKKDPKALRLLARYGIKLTFVAGLILEIADADDVGAQETMSGNQNRAARVEVFRICLAAAEVPANDARIR